MSKTRRYGDRSRDRRRPPRVPPRRRPGWRAVPWWLVGTVGVGVVVVTALLLLLPKGSHSAENHEDRGALQAPTPSAFDARRVGSLEVSTQSVDLGHVALAKEVASTFRLRNVGQEPVTIVIASENVKTLEGC